MTKTLFYSWQTDKPAKLNKNLIEQAAQMAIKRILAGNEFVVELALDRDTKGVPGSPSVIQTILDKIEKCGLFLADVTIVGTSVASESHKVRQIPNPNVLIELGYAAAKIGWNRIVCVMNEGFGKADDLPFDLKERRWPIRYSLHPDVTSQEVRQAREELSNQIELAIRTAILSGVLVDTVNPKDKLLANKIEMILNHFTSRLIEFFEINGLEGGHDLFWQHSPDEGPVDDDRIRERLQPFIASITPETLLRISPNAFDKDGKNITWAKHFEAHLRDVGPKLDPLLDRYCERHDVLVTLMEMMQSRAGQIAYSMWTFAQTPQPTTSQAEIDRVNAVNLRHIGEFIALLVAVYGVLNHFRYASIKFSDIPFSDRQTLDT